MRTIQIIIFSLFTVPIVLAQPVLTNSSNFAFGDSYRIDSYIELSNASPGPSGPNVFWDFETIAGGTFVEGITAICIDPAGTPFADSAAVAASNLCIRPLDNPDYGAYQYYHSGYNNRELLGMGWLETGNTSFGSYQPPFKALEFPFAFNDSFTGAFEYQSYHLGFGCYFMRDSAEVETVADAWGTIKTPIGEFENVLRLKTTTTYYSWYRFSAGTPWVFLGEFTDVQYDWYMPGMKVPLLIFMEMNFSDDAFYNIEYLAEFNFTTGTEEQTEQDVLLFPNPATNFIQVKTGTSELQKITIINQHGQTVLEKNGFNSMVDVSHLKSGLYSVLIQTSKDIFQQKIIIK